MGEVTVKTGDGVDVLRLTDCAVLLFQSVRELLMNALKYADSTQQCEGWRDIVVREDSVGFDLAAAAVTRQPPSSDSSVFVNV